MSKRFRITVNGQAYDVLVEEVSQESPAQEVKPERPQVAPPVAVPVVRPEPKPVAVAQTRPQPKPATAPSRAAGPAPAASKGVVTAPIPGVIGEVKVRPGDKVSERSILMMLEAMKMQNEINAPFAGVVREVFVSAGTTVSTGDRLVSIDPE